MLTPIEFIVVQSLLSRLQTSFGMESALESPKKGDGRRQNRPHRANVFRHKAEGIYGLYSTSLLFSYSRFNHQYGQILPTRGKGIAMVAPRKIRRVFCTVVRVPNADESCMVSENRIQHRPSDRLPWSDPTIARLVANLQDEVRRTSKCQD